jgi:PAS domain S-box-containing protein
LWESKKSLEYSTELTATNFAVVGRGTENTMELPVQQQDDALPKLTSPTGGLEQPTDLVRSDLDRIVSDLPNGFATFDREWRYTYANNRLLEIFKLSRVEVIGKRAWEVFPHQVSVDFFDRLNRAMTERIEAQFEFYYEIADCWVEHRVYPTADGLAILMADITERKQAEKISQRAAKFDSFRITLADALRPLADPVAIQATASRVLGEHLGANRVAYFEVRGAIYVVERDYLNDATPLVGNYPIDAFGSQVLAAYRNGRVVSESDLATDLSLSPTERAAYAALDLVAYIGVPLLKGGELVAVLTVQMSAPRVWTSDEVAIVEEVAERTWAALERARAEAALRESEAKYRTLFDSIDEGFCIVEAIFDAEEKPVDYRFLQANPAFVRLTGLPADALGKTALELVPDLEQFWVETYGKVALTGESVRFENKSEPMNRWFDVYASRVGDAASRRVAIVFNNITERKQAEKISQRAAKFDAFRLTLADALRPLADPVAIQATASRVLGEHLGANCVAYFEVRGANYIIERDYLNGGTSLVGSYPVDSFGSQVRAALRSGRVVSESDVATDLSLSPAERAAYAAVGVVAYLCVPLVKDGEFVAGLVIHTSTPRVWTPDEVAIAEEVAERTWAALERARAEAALRESEAKYRTLFQSMDEGYVLMDLIFDAEDRPVDLYYLEANPAAVGMMGTNPVGLQASEVFAIESHWMETLGRVAKTGIGERQELQYAQLDTWYNFYVFKIGGADSRRIAFIYEDVTERKRREANLAFLTEIQDEFTRLVSADEIMQTVGAKIGAYLNVTHCTFVEIDDAQDTAIVLCNWHTSGLPDTISVCKLSEFVSEEFRQAARARETIVICNTQTDDARIDGDGHKTFNIHAFVSVPFHRGNEWKYSFNVTDSRSRDWREDEIELISELANRIFPRLDRARAEAVVAANLRDTRLLRDLSARLVTENDIETLYREILATAIALTGADGGLVRILDDRSQDFLLIGSQGFDRQMNEDFYRVNRSSQTPCGIALRHGERAFIDFDVPEADDPDGTMRRHVEAGYRSAQCTLLFSRTGRPLGMVTTHWRSHHRPSDRQLRALDLLARQAADLIEQQQTTAALRESEEQLRLASDAAKVGMWFWNLETDSLIWTEQCKSLFGLPAETEMSYAVFLAAIHPDDRQHTDAAVTRSIAEHTDYDIECRCCWSDGSVHWIAAKGSCSYDPTGKPLRMMGVAIDINDLKQAQIELQQSLAILNTINQATPTLIFVKDRQGRVRMGNPALMCVLGKPESEVLGYTDAEFYPNPEDATVIMATDRQVMETGQTQVVEETLDLPEGRRTFLSTKSPYADETGTIVGLVGVAFDISLRKQMEAALADRNQELDSFVYIVSHDLKAPLRAISNLSVWIEEDLGTDLPAEIGQHMTQLRGRVRRMEAMIDGLLGYARVGRTDVQIELVSVAELLAEILDSLMPPSTFEITIAPNMPTFPTKRLLLSQVFSNLIGNAFKHHDKSNGLIRISCQEQGDFYEFTIVDDGPGISLEQHDRVFVIFQSTNPQKNPDSTGIGLSIVKKIVETAGGKIWLESLGRGTTFYFTWPK